jgi:hypothetical protein
MGSDIGRIHSGIESISAKRPTSSLTYSSLSPRNKEVLRQPSGDGRTIGYGFMKGLGRIVKSAIRPPMTFTLALTQGAHNLPRTWADTTVRPQEKVTGVGSGLVAAAKVCL